MNHLLLSLVVEKAATILVVKAINPSNKSPIDIELASESTGQIKSIVKLAGIV